MVLPERVSGNLEQLGLKKNSLRKAFLRLALEWKDLDDHLDAAKKYYNESLGGLDTKCKTLEANRESIEESNRELDVVRESLESRRKEVERREDKLRSFVETQIEELKVKEEQLAALRTGIEEKLVEDQLREERLSEQKKSIEELLERFKTEKQEFEDIKKSVALKLNEIGSKERNFEAQSKELRSIQDWIERRAGELDSREEKVELREKELKAMQILNEERCEELRIIRQELDLAQKKNTDRVKRLRYKEIQLNSDQKYHNQCSDDFRSKNKQLKVEQEMLEKRVEERYRDLELKEKQLDKRLKDFELKEKLLVKRSRKNVWKRKQFDVDNSQVKNRAALNLPAEIIAKDGRSLQIYLNERFEYHGSLSGEVHKILGLSSDPAKLVLDAMEGFYPPHLKSGDVECKASVVRSSCVLLLDQLLRISPLIRPHVRKEALRLADEWKMKMVVSPNNGLTVLPFIQLLASYKLVCNFSAEEILQLLEFIPLSKQVSELCRCLGLQDMVPDFIRKLVDKGLHLIAIDYVCAFNISSKFSPATLIEGYIFNIEEAAEKMREEGHYSVEARDIACEKELNALKAVMRCMRLHELESQYPPEKITARIEQLERRRIHIGSLASSYPSMAQQEERFDSHAEEMHMKMRKTSPSGHANDAQFHPFHSKKHFRNTLPDRPYEHSSDMSTLRPSSYLRSQVGDYCSGHSTSTSSYMSRYDDGSKVYKGFSPFKFSIGGNFSPPSYDA